MMVRRQALLDNVYGEMRYRKSSRNVAAIEAVLYVPTTRQHP